MKAEMEMEFGFLSLEFGIPSSAKHQRWPEGRARRLDSPSSVLHRQKLCPAAEFERRALLPVVAGTTSNTASPPFRRARSTKLRVPSGSRGNQDPEPVEGEASPYHFIP